MIPRNVRDRRALLLGIVSMVAMLGFSRGVPRWQRWIETTEEKAWQAQVRLTRATWMMEQSTAISESLAVTRGRHLALRSRLLHGRSAATVGASLLSTVSETASWSNLQLGSIAVTSDTVATRHFWRVAVRGDAVGDVEGLAGFLEALESLPVYLRIRELAVDQPDPAAPDDQPEALRIRFLIEGLSLRGEDL